jgi:hypothetical protein
MPSANFSIDITSIFNNSQLSDDLKHDVRCRLVCENLGVSSVFMLIYNAVEDKLKCRASYIIPSNPL